MFENIDDLIELNLKLLAESITQSVFKHSFLDENGNNLKKSEIFAKILEDKRLITFEPKQRFRCDLTEFGRDIIINGGWIKYLETEKTELIENQTTSNISIQNYIGGNNHGIQSSKRAFKSPITQTMKPTAPKEPITKSVLEIVSWIAGIIATIIVVYEFVIKK